jgi:hypothetical protein
LNGLKVDLLPNIFFANKLSFEVLGSRYNLIILKILSPLWIEIDALRILTDDGHMTSEAATRRIIAENTTAATWFEARLNRSHECYIIPLSPISPSCLPHLFLHLLYYRVIIADIDSDWTAVAVQRVVVEERRVVAAFEPQMAIGTLDLLVCEASSLLHSPKISLRKGHEARLTVKGQYRYLYCTRSPQTMPERGAKSVH